MLPAIADGNSRLPLWLRVREFAVPPSMIETSAARRSVGDWAGACAAAHVDVDLDLRTVARTHGLRLAARVRADLRRLAPDLLRWHMPRIAPDGLLRPGLTISLARYEDPGGDGGHPVHLVARTPPAWADAGQRFGLALWDGARPRAGAVHHPHPRPDRRFRLDLHRHLWDADRSDELRTRSGAGLRPASGGPTARSVADRDPLGLVPRGHGLAADRWGAEAQILLRAEGRSAGTVTVRVGARRRLDLVLFPDGDRDRGRDGHGPGDPDGPLAWTVAPSSEAGGLPAPPVLPDAATWIPPDLELIRAGLIEPGRLHPLVAAALVPDQAPAGPSARADRAGQPRLVECRGDLHRIGQVDGVLVPLDHGPDEIRREELLAALGGTPLPCLRVIDEAHRRPDCLSDVRERLDHGDTAGALAVVEALLGPGALLRDGPLRDALEAAAQRRITYGLFRSGMTGPGPGRIRPGPERPRGHRSRPRHTHGR
ncbi:hypothetical protein ACWGDE_10745 [Streptomyces sp. NPDC054956]